MKKHHISEILKKINRIELVPSLLNIPILLGALVFLYLGTNSEETEIFGLEANYVVILKISLFFILGYIVLLILFSVYRREKVPVWLYCPPILFLLVYGVIISFFMNNNDYITINYVYQLLGHTLSLIIYLVFALVLIANTLYHLNGLPKLWKNSSDASSRYHYKTLTIITLVGYMIISSLLILLLSGHHSMIFWQMISFVTNPSLIITILQIILITTFIFIEKAPQPLLSKLKLSKKPPLKLSVIIIQGLLLILIGIQNESLLVLLSPLSLVFFTQIWYILISMVYPHIKKRFNLPIREKNQHILKKVVIVTPLIWIVLFQPLIGLPPQPDLPDQELQIERNSYSTLTDTQRVIFDTLLNSKVPFGTTAEEIIADGSSLRGFSRYASALLFRDSGDDILNAVILLEHITTNLIVNQDGSFLGCELILILEKYHEKLPQDLIESIKNALISIAEGAYQRNVRPTYTNIALMGALIMNYVGEKMNIPKIREAGIRKSWEIFLLFQRNNTFSEFNSPTYCGVDMVALAMWREFGPTETMRNMGEMMELALWEEISEFYHPSFKNFCGPYIRSYGMDMKSYYAIIGIWIALAMDDIDNAPLPDGLSNVHKFFELYNIIPIVQLGHVIPDSSSLQDFNEFTEPRFLEKWIPSDISDIGLPYKVTAMLQPDWMMGGISGRIRDSGQFISGTLHWNSTDDSLAWLLVSGPSALDVEVSTESMTITQTFLSDNIIFYLNCNNLTLDLISSSIWNFPGISLEIDGDPSKISAKMANVTRFKQIHDIREDFSNLIEITCQMKELTLKIIT